MLIKLVKCVLKIGHTQHTTQDMQNASETCTITPPLPHRNINGGGTREADKLEALK
jgi:hypothetical protein